MIARGEAIGAAALGDSGRRILPGEWQGPALPLAAPDRAPPRRRRFVARR